MNQIVKKNVLVTGASGFVGTNLVSALVRRGYSVSCLVRTTSDTEALRGQGVRLIYGDINDPSALRDAVHSVNTIYHVAGAIKAAHREDYFRINQAGTRLTMESVAENNPDLGRFVHLSTLAAAGPSSGNRGLTEAEKPNPISWYGESKLKSEAQNDLRETKSPPRARKIRTMGKIRSLVSSYYRVLPGFELGNIALQGIVPADHIPQSGLLIIIAYCLFFQVRGSPFPETTFCRIKAHLIQYPSLPVKRKIIS